MPLPRYARCPRRRKLGSVSSVNSPSRSRAVAVPMKVRLGTIAACSVPVQRRVMAAIRGLDAGLGPGRIDFAVVVERGVRATVALPPLRRRDVPVNEAVALELDDRLLDRADDGPVVRAADQYDFAGVLRHPVSPSGAIRSPRPYPAGWRR